MVRTLACQARGRGFKSRPPRHDNMAFNVYIIQSEVDSTLYIGHTNNIEERIQRHNQGRSQYTKLKRPWKLVFREEFSNRSEAMQREAKLKSLHRKDLLLQLIRNSD